MLHFLLVLLVLVFELLFFFVTAFFLLVFIVAALFYWCFFFFLLLHFFTRGFFLTAILSFSMLIYNDIFTVCLVTSIVLLLSSITWTDYFCLYTDNFTSFLYCLTSKDTDDFWYPKLSIVPLLGDLAILLRFIHCNFSKISFLFSKLTLLIFKLKSSTLKSQSKGARRYTICLIMQHETFPCES